MPSATEVFGAQEAAQALLLLVSRRKALDATFWIPADSSAEELEMLWQDPRGGASTLLDASLGGDSDTVSEADSADSAGSASSAGSPSPTDIAGEERCGSTRRLSATAASLHSASPARQRVRMRRKGIRMEAKRRWSRRVGVTVTSAN
jgi:hypothetical protein